MNAYHKSLTQQNRYLTVVKQALGTTGLTELLPPQGIGLNTAVCRCRDVIRAFAADDSILSIELRDELRERLANGVFKIFIRDGRAYIGDPKAKPSERQLIEVATSSKVERIVLRAISVLVAYGLMDSFEAEGYTKAEAEAAVVSGCMVYNINNKTILSI